MIRRLAALAMTAVLLSAAGCEPQEEMPPLPALLYQEEGVLEGAPYRLEVPANWNGTLLLYGHGYRDKADSPEEADDFTPILAPSLASLDDGGMEGPLLAEGYALAGTAYRENGMILEEGPEDLDRLARHARSVLTTEPALVARGPLRKTIAIACSMGGLFAYQLAGHPQAAADGFITLGALTLGTATADYILALQLAYDVAFGFLPEWGRPGDVRNAGDDPAHPDDFDVDEVLPVVATQLATTPGRARWEFIRRIVGVPLEGFDFTQDNPGWFVMAFLMSEIASEWERRLGGFPGRNRDHVYRLSASDKEAVRALDPLLDPEDLLARMNARTGIEGPPALRNAVARLGDTRGDLERPVLALHSIGDSIVPPFHEGLIRERIVQAGRSHLHAPVFAAQPTHGTFLPVQILHAIRAMET